MKKSEKLSGKVKDNADKNGHASFMFELVSELVASIVIIFVEFFS